MGGLAALPRRQMDGHRIAGQRPGKSSGRAARLITECENLMMPNCASQVWHLNRLIRFIRQCLTALRFAVKKNVWSNPLDEFHYNNFSYGLLGSDTCNDPKNLGYCQPLQSRFETRLGTVGGPGQGLWFAMNDNLYPCRGKWLFSICGHYFEWGGMSNDPDITIANRVAVDVATHREYCQLE
ncbi:hypothetical protein AB8878_08360 [Alphaproteobacteria bacterium LSUCC0226]